MNLLKKVLIMLIVVLILIILGFTVLFIKKSNKFSFNSKEDNLINAIDTVIIFLNDDDTTGFKYPILPSIAQICMNPIFSDNILLAWNQVSIDYTDSLIAKERDKEMIDNLLYNRQFFEVGHNLRTEFSYMLNNNSLITEQDFFNGFYIIEEITEGEVANILYYLIKEIENKLEVLIFQYGSNHYGSSWTLLKKKKIEKQDFGKFLILANSQKRNEGGRLVRTFNINYFTLPVIKSYIFMNPGTLKSYTFFHKIID